MWPDLVVSQDVVHHKVSILFPFHALTSKEKRLGKRAAGDHLLRGDSSNHNAHHNHNDAIVGRSQCIYRPCFHLYILFNRSGARGKAKSQVLIFGQVQLSSSRFNSKMKRPYVFTFVPYVDIKWLWMFWWLTIGIGEGNCCSSVANIVDPSL